MPLAGLLLAAGVLACGPAGADSGRVVLAQADQPGKGAQIRERTRTRAGQREIIPGSELMTGKEREQYRQRMAGATSDEERERLRAEHVKAMQERARVRGLQLAEPAAAGSTTK